MPGIIKTPSELILTGYETLPSEIHGLVNSICNGTIVPTNKMDDKIDCHLTTIHCCQTRIT
jgi:hypothetical protein